MTDLTDTIKPKSNQLNADDLIGGPITITITGVSKTSAAEQPVAIQFDGDDGKPYLPCKMMRRVLVMQWGPDANQYVGRSLTLYRDPDVTWGGMKVGGIRISHMSHIDGEKVMALTASKSQRKPYTVLPLVVQAKRDLYAEGLEQAGKGMDALKDWFAKLPAKDKAIIKPKLDELKEKVNEENA